jgi:hypothetical protein
LAVAGRAMGGRGARGAAVSVDAAVKVLRRPKVRETLGWRDPIGSASEVLGDAMHRAFRARHRRWGTLPIVSAGFDCMGEALHVSVELREGFAGARGVAGPQSARPSWVGVGGAGMRGTRWAAGRSARERRRCAKVAAARSAGSLQRVRPNSIGFACGVECAWISGRFDAGPPAARLRCRAGVGVWSTRQRRGRRSLLAEMMRGRLPWSVVG